MLYYYRLNQLIFSTFTLGSMVTVLKSYQLHCHQQPIYYANFYYIYLFTFQSDYNLVCVVLILIINMFILILKKTLLKLFKKILKKGFYLLNY